MLMADFQVISLPFPHPSDPCLVVMPPCMGEADRYSLEALRHIHKQLDDDNDGGIEVNESVEVSVGRGLHLCQDCHFIKFFHSLTDLLFNLALLLKYF